MAQSHCYLLTEGAELYRVLLGFYNPALSACLEAPRTYMQNEQILMPILVGHETAGLLLWEIYPE